MNKFSKVRNKIIQKQNPLDRQRGVSIIELSVWLALVLVIIMVGMPALNGWLIEGRVPSVGNETVRLMARLRVMGESGGTHPFANVSNQRNLVPALRGSSALKIDEASNTIAHNLGGRGSGNHGTLSIAPAAFDGSGAGSAYQLTFTNVHDRACPTLASVLATSSDLILINGNVVKRNVDASSHVAYNAIDSQLHCLDGENNTFVFTSR